MDKRNFVSVTLLISALAFNPLIANDTHINATNSLRHANTLTHSIASALYNRGLDEDVAYNLSQDLVDENDELLDMMIHNLVSVYHDISYGEVVEHLSTLALHRQSIDLASYEHLVSMLSKIKGHTVTKDALKQLDTVSKLNQLIIV